MRYTAAVLWLVALIALTTPCRAAEGERFTEELVVRPLPSGHLLVHFHFHLDTPAKRHHEVFPKAISQLANAVAFHELELSLSHGRWHFNRWGSPVLPAKPVGAELRAAFSPGEPFLPQQWGNLSHALSGLFCASLNFLARPETTAQQAIDMHPSGPAPAHHVWLYAALPKEAVCTENLTPWLRLLPCRDQEGVAALLRSRPTLYGADYHSMRVHIKVERTPCGAAAAVHLTQTLSLVLRPATHSSRHQQRAVPLPRALPDWDLASTMGTALERSCPLAQQSRVYVQLPPGFEHAAVTLAGHVSTGTEQHSPGEKAAAASAASMEHDMGSSTASWETPAFTLSPAPDAALLASPAGIGDASEPQLHSAFLMYDLHARRRRRARQQRAAARTLQDVASKLEEDASSDVRPPSLPQQEQLGLELSQVWRRGQDAGSTVQGVPHWEVHRYTTGYGNMNGGMVLELRAVQGKQAGVAGGGSNPAHHESSSSSSKSSSGNGDGKQSVCIFQIVPWYIRVWLHTLRLQINGQPADVDAHLQLRHVSPAKDRALPLVLELCLGLPANATSVSLLASFSKGFLTVFEYPPDAHRGFDISAAIITFPTAANASGRSSNSAGALAWTAVHSGSTCTCNGTAGGAGPCALTPLLQHIAQPHAEQVYSEGLLVQLAPPDFSMPYNVICLTSTVLAVYIGATLNTLLRRPEPPEDAKAAGGASTKGRWSSPAARKALKFVVVLVVFGGLGLYMDPGLQESMQDAVRAAAKALGVDPAVILG